MKRETAWLLAAAFLLGFTVAVFSFRYTVTVGGGTVVRYNRWTGESWLMRPGRYWVPLTEKPTTKEE